MYVPKYHIFNVNIPVVDVTSVVVVVVSSGVVVVTVEVSVVEGCGVVDSVLVVVEAVVVTEFRLNITEW